MPVAETELEIGRPLELIWDAVQDFGLLASAMPGYQRHETLDDRTSIWHLKSDIGIFQRPVSFRVEITEREAPVRIGFTLAALGEKIEGGGEFQAVAVAPDRTLVRFRLQMEGSGMLAPVVNALLEKTLPRDVAALARGTRELLMQHSVGPQGEG